MTIYCPSNWFWINKMWSHTFATLNRQETENKQKKIGMQNWNLVFEWKIPSCLSSQTWANNIELIWSDHKCTFLYYFITNRFFYAPLMCLRASVSICVCMYVQKSALVNMFNVHARNQKWFHTKEFLPFGTTRFFSSLSKLIPILYFVFSS